MQDRKKLTAKRLRKVIGYNTKTGKFIRLESGSNAAKIGSNPCYLTAYGYYTISVDGVRHQASRLAWLHTTGKHPKKDIDHVDGIRTNNVFKNLRDVRRSMNLENLKIAKKSNKSTGLLGVYLRKDTGRFSAKITVDFVAHALGCFATAESAHAAYVSAKRKLHKGCTI